MKKRFLIIPLLLLLIFSSCNTINKKQEIQEPSLISIPVTINSNAQILFFDSQKIYYFLDRQNPKTPDLTDKTLYEYTFSEKRSNKICSFLNISTYSGATALMDKTFYIALATNNENLIARVDVEKKSWEIMKKWKTFPPISYIYLLNKNLIVFGPDIKSDSITDYYINKIDSVKKKDINIVKKRIDNQKGELISCIDVDQKNIYAFSSTSKNGVDEAYQITQYDENGNKSAAYPFDLKDYFASKNTLVEQDDPISGLYKEKEYFILNTLNGRIFIFKLCNHSLQPVKLSEKFYKEYPSGFRFIDCNDNDSNFAYFYNSLKNNDEVFLFDCSSGKISSLKIPQSKAYCYYRNVRGDLIVETNDEPRKFYFYSVNSLIK